MTTATAEPENAALIARLRTERDQLIDAQALAIVGSWETDLTTLDVVWSDQTFRIFGLQPSSVLPTHAAFLGFVHPEDRARVDAAFQASFADQQERVVAHRIVLANGEVKEVEERWRVFVNGDGVPVRALGTCQDVTARREFHGELLRTQSLLSMASRLSRLGWWRVEPPFSHVVWSIETALIHDEAPGFSPPVDRAVAYYLPPSRDLILQSFMACLEHGVGFDVECEIKTAKGRSVWVRSIGEAVRNSSGQIISVEGAFQDITDFKRASAALEQTSRAFKLLSRVNEALVCSSSEQDLLDTVVRIAADSGDFRLACIGYATAGGETSLDIRAWSGVNDGYLEAVSANWSLQHAGDDPARRAIRSGAMVLIPDCAAHPGFAPWLPAATAHGFRGVVCFPLQHEENSFGVLCLYLGEIRMPQSEELRFLGDLANNVSFGIMSLRERAERRRTEQAVLTIARGMMANSATTFFDQLLENTVKALGADAGFIANVSKDGTRGESLFCYLDGRPGPKTEWNMAGTPCEHLTGTEVFVVDRQAREQFPRAEALNAIGIEAYVGTCLVDSRGDKLGMMFVLYRNPLVDSVVVASTLQIFAARAASEFERVRADEQLREQASVLDAAHDAIIIRDLDQRVVSWNQGAQRLYGWSASEAIGKLIVDVLRTDPAAFAAAELALFATGEWVGESIKATRGGEKRTIEGHWTLVNDERGAPKSVLMMDTDITERRKLETQLLRTQRMESLGTLAGGIAHDLNNMLAPLLLSIGWLREQHPDDDTQEVLHDIETSVQRGADLVQQVLSFARGVDGRRLQVKVMPLINEVKGVVRDTFPKSVVFDFQGERDLWPVTGDPTQLHQVILNLCVNARDAMPNGGTLTIRAGNIALDETYCAMNPESKPGGYVTIEVCDTGVGIPRDIQDRIFEPFFTTKAFGKGTGLGLSTCHSIARNHKGFIVVSSELGKGSRFDVYLPADLTTPPTPAARSAPVQLPRGNGELVLVVDDEAAIRTLSRRILERFGYKVLVAENGAEAVALYEANAADIAVVITDMSMPVMDGPTAVVMLKALNPAVRIVGSSGIHADGKAEKARSLGVSDWLAKPYTTEALLQLLRMVIGA